MCLVSGHGLVAVDYLRHRNPILWYQEEHFWKDRESVLSKQNCTKGREKRDKNPQGKT